jgi:chromosome segregation ATPase
MTTATKPAADTLAEINQALQLTKLKSVTLGRDLTAARTQAVASGVVGGTNPRVTQLTKKLAEAETRIADLEEELSIAHGLAEQEAELATRARIEELKTQAERQKAAEAEAWNAAREAFAGFVAASSTWARLAQEQVDVYGQTAHEFSQRPELEGLLAGLRPHVYPLARDLGDILHLLTREVDTSGVRVGGGSGLDHVSRSPDRPWSSDTEVTPWTTNFG